MKNEQRSKKVHDEATDYSSNERQPEPIQVALAY